MKTFTQDEAIKWLVSNDIDDIMQSASDSDYTWLSDMLHGGFTGYNNFTKEQLQRELTDRYYGEEEVEIV